MTDTEEFLIEAKVARVLNATDVALNKGSDDGVEVGMRFAILSTRGYDIADPDTNERLGSIELAKTLVKVVSVTPRVAVARTFRKKDSLGISALLNQGSTRYETLQTNERRLQQELDPKDSFVKVGDEAVQYEGEYTGIVYDF